MAIKIFDNFNLKSYNTFGIDVVCKKFIEYTENDDIITFVRTNLDIFRSENFFILGNGSNVLFKNNFYDGIIIHSQTNKIDGINIDAFEQKISVNCCRVVVDAGVDFDRLIVIMLASGLLGLENLSGIPGCVGASIVQNIGAYGSEVAEFVTSVDYLDLMTGEIRSITKQECNFSYRDSIFKHSLFGFLLSKHYLNDNHFGV
jgi:UDP-N-acetylmuramate dehydrogenase